VLVAVFCHSLLCASGLSTPQWPQLPCRSSHTYREARLTVNNAAAAYVRFFLLVVNYLIIDTLATPS
jgi:hypothetical protein